MPVTLLAGKLTLEHSSQQITNTRDSSDNNPGLTDYYEWL